MQTRVCELHLGLDARRPRDPEAGRVTGKMLEQRCLADPRLAAKNEHPALPRSHAREQIVEDIALSSPSAQRGLHHLSKRQDSMLFAPDSGVKPGHRPGTSRARRADALNMLASPDQAPGDEMESDAHSDSQPSGRFTLALFVIAELLCTAALIAWVVL